jgi:hypothetical protein
VSTSILSDSGSRSSQRWKRKLQTNLRPCTVATLADPYRVMSKGKTE